MPTKGPTVAGIEFGWPVLNMGVSRDWGLKVMLSKRLEHIRRLNSQARPHQGSRRAYAYPRGSSRSAMSLAYYQDAQYWVRLSPAPWLSFPAPDFLFPQRTYHFTTRPCL